MRATILFCCISLALGGIASIAACAESETNSQATPSPDPGGSSSLPDEGGPKDGGATEAAATDAGADGSGEACSAAGWCRTSLPDEDLTLKDLSAAGETAFAIAHSPTLGMKVLEWRNADSAWAYIDDGTQHTVDYGTYAGRIWSPSADEVYYGVGAGYVYHGKRAAPPATSWNWTRQRLGRESDTSPASPVRAEDLYPTYPYSYADLQLEYPTLGVWGTSAGDVYAWFVDTLYHRTSVGGADDTWVPEYVADDAASGEHIYFFAAAGTGPGDIWFSGTRTTSSLGCAILVRKTGGAYQRVADGTPTNDYSDCDVRDGRLLIAGTRGFAQWLTDIQMRSPNQLVGLVAASDLVRVSITEDGYSASVGSLMPAGWPFVSLWAAPGSLWLSGSGVVYRADSDPWDGGSFQISTLAINGAPFEQRVSRVRGTSTTNLWAIGAGNALHKTTP